MKLTKLLNILSLLFLCICFIVPQMSQRSMMRMIQCRSQSYSFSRRLHSSPSRSWTSCALTDWSYCNITWATEVCETGDNPLELRWTTEPNCHNHISWAIYSNADSFFDFAIIACTWSLWGMSNKNIIQAGSENLWETLSEMFSQVFFFFFYQVYTHYCSNGQGQLGFFFFN